MARTQAADYDKRREAIIDTGIELFAEKGYANTSVSALAKAGNISKSLIYHYFPSKEEILFEAMNSTIDPFIQTAQEITAGPGTALEKLSKLIHAFLHLNIEVAGRSKVLSSEIENLSGPFRKIITTKHRKIVELTQALISPIDKKFTRQPNRAHVQAMLLLGMIIWTNNWYDPKGPIGIDKLAKMIMENVK